jgi:M6 family metalloprotease-like protein
MKGKWLGFPLIFLLLSAAIFSFTNDAVVEDWLKNNSIIVKSDDANILPIQENENWPILIVDFNGRNTNQATAINDAEEMLIPHANNYFSQLSRGSVSVDVDVHQVMVTASGGLAAYGSDNGGERDSSNDGTHLPMLLAEEVVVANKQSIDWDKYDLDNDGSVDRLLILHTAIGQESGGNSNRIWSHFTTFETPIDLGNDLTVAHYAMASLGSKSDGFGTAMHEMLHQMGAYDLYPSDGQQTSIWKGVGDWDIMASGNWNDDGKTPSLPMSSTLETIGLNNFQTINFDWSQQTDYCSATSIIFSPQDNMKLDYKIQIGQGEYVWIEYRGGNQYDSELPGTGILVSYQDTTIDGYEDNELNVNNQRPYLKIIEADGNDELLTGGNEGQSSDLFDNGSKFGSIGIEIRNHDGILVDWYAEVVINNQIEIMFKSDYCESNFELDLPNHSVTTLPNEPIQIEALSTADCILQNGLSSTDGRLVSIYPNQIQAGIESVISVAFNSAAQHNSMTKLVGTISCESEIRDIDIEILSLSILPKNSSFATSIPVTSKTQISIPIDSIGTGSHNFEYKIDGPLSRIAHSEQILRLTESDDFLIIDIDPNNLLSNNMIVNGVIEISDSNDNLWVVEVVLTAESSAAKSLNDYISPGQMVGLACIFAALWIFLTMKENQPVNIEEIIEKQYYQENDEEKISYDAWGRQIDD